MKTDQSRPRDIRVDPCLIRFDPCTMYGMKPSTRLLIFIILLAVLLRVGVALYLGDTTPPGKDESSYSLLAARLASGHGYSFADWHYPFTPSEMPTAHWSFLYTALVAAIYTGAGVHPLAVRLVQAVLTGLLMPWLTWRLARRAGSGHWALGSGQWAVGSRHLPISNLQSPISHSPISQSPNLLTSLPLLAALLAAFYAYFVLYGAMTQTEGLFLLAVVWSLERALAVQEKLAIGNWRLGDWGVVVMLGVSVAVATLLRQSILPWVAVMLVWLLAADGVAQRRVRGRTLAALAVVGAILLAAVLPFTLRNYRVYGELLLLNSNAGYAMYSAQHPLHRVSFDAYAAAPLPGDLTPPPANEAQWDRALMARGVQFVLDDPGRYLLLSASRAVDYFEFWPKTSSSLLFNVGRMASFTLLLPFMVYGVWMVGRGTSLFSPPVFLLLFVLVYSLLHIFTWAMPRYRLPVDAVLLIFAAAGLSDLVRRTPWIRRRWDADQNGLDTD